MFGKIENWLGELCAAASTEDEEDEAGLLTYETFDSLIPEEQYENGDEDEDKRNVTNDAESHFNVNRSRKYRVKHVNVRPAPKSETLPSEELDQEDCFDRREARRRRCIRQYNSPGVSVFGYKNNKGSEERKTENSPQLRQTSSFQKQEYFSDICQGNLFDPQDVTVASGFTKYRFPKSGKKYLEAKPEFSKRHSRKPHPNMLIPCNWTTEELSPAEPDPQPEPAPPQIPCKQSNTASRLFRKKQFRFSGKQGNTKEKLEEIPLTRVLEDDKEEDKSELRAKDEDNCSSDSLETIESDSFLSHELINKPQQYSEEVFHDPFYVEDPQANEPAECKVNICIMNLGNDEGTWSSPADREVKDSKKRLGKIQLPGLKLASKPNMEDEMDISYTDVEPLKEGNWF